MLSKEGNKCEIRLKKERMGDDGKGERKGAKGREREGDREIERGEERGRERENGTSDDKEDSC